MIRPVLIAAGVSGALAVMLGAFGAHALESALDADARAVYDTAVRYHFLHTLALFAGAVGVAAGGPHRPLALACGAWLAGTLVFSGSLYALALTGAGWLGAVTPIGGVALIIGWTALAVAGWQARPRRA